MYLARVHPKLPSCADCAQFIYDEDWNLQKRQTFGLPVVPLARPKGMLTPCVRCPKIPLSAAERTREHAVELFPHNRKAYFHYLDCRAVMQFPDDPWVRLHARVIREQEDAVERAERDDLLRLIALLAGSGHG